MTAFLLTLVPKQYTRVAALLCALFHHERKVAPGGEREAVSGPRS